MRARFWLALFPGLVVLASGGVGRGAEADPELAAAEKTLQDAHQASDGPALVKFFEQRTLSEADRKKLAGVVRQLGDDEFAARRKAYKDLQAAGRPALAFLRTAMKSPDPEVARSAERLVREIESGADLALTAAAARVLAVRKPAGATPALLAYLPAAGDETVEQAVLDALAAVGLRDGKVNPALTAALKGNDPARRAAAAYVHGKGGPEQRQALKPLLTDTDAWVRFRAATALVRAGDKSAIAPLLALLSEAPDSLAWQTEDLLLRIAGQQAPATSLGSAPAERQKCRETWTAWWKANEGKIDLAKVDFKGALRGLTLVCDCDTGKGLGGKLWEFGPDGKERWQFSGVRTVVDVQLLAGGKLLIAEGSGYQVSERDRDGKVLWSHKTNGYATTARRLPNGNTFFAGYSEIGEVTPQGKVVFSYRSPLGTIYRVQRLRNGHLLFASGACVMEIDGTGKEVRRVVIPGGTGIWTHVELLPNGNFLVSQYSSGRVIELDAAGKIQWQVNVTTPSSASRLPNGNILVSSMDARCLIEFNKQGKEVWKMTTQGRPFLVRRY